MWQNLKLINLSPCSAKGLEKSFPINTLHKIKNGSPFRFQTHNGSQNRSCSTQPCQGLLCLNPVESSNPLDPTPSIIAGLHGCECEMQTELCRRLVENFDLPLAYIKPVASNHLFCFFHFTSALNKAFSHTYNVYILWQRVRSDFGNTFQHINFWEYLPCEMGVKAPQILGEVSVH